MLAKVEGLLSDGVRVEKIVAAEPTHLDPRSLFLEITEEVTGAPARLVKACGGSDGRFFREEGVPVLLSRPRVGNLHGRDEWIEIDSMLSYFEICRRYLERVLGEETR
jgi:succinyl-diaminopimelate desuccinylase